MTGVMRTPVREKAKEIVPFLKEEKPDYDYLRELFRHLRKELSVCVPKKEKSIKKIPSQADIKKFYQVLDNDNNNKNKIMLQTLLYTGVRVSELVNIKITDVDIDKCQIHIQKGVRGQQRIVFFSTRFKALLKKHMAGIEKRRGVYLFESSWNKPYSDRGVRKIMSMYSKKAGLKDSLSPNTIRTFLLSWLKQQGIEDERLLIYSGHEGRYALSQYHYGHNRKKIGIEGIQSEYESTIQKLPFLTKQPHSKVLSQN